jgi:hypothetical protein
MEPVATLGWGKPQNVLGLQRIFDLSKHFYTQLVGVSKPSAPPRHSTGAIVGDKICKLTKPSRCFHNLVTSLPSS